MFTTEVPVFPSTVVARLIDANHGLRYRKGITSMGFLVESTINRSDKLRYVERFAALHGLKFLGRGAFASAWKMLDGRVLKIGSEEDDAYHFNVWCMNNRGAPGVPNVYEVRRVPGGWYCVMERITTAESLGEWSPPEEVWEAVHAFANATGSSCDDVHQGNWGQTCDGRFVTIDPTSDSSCGLPPAERLPRNPPKRQYGPQPRGAARWH